MLSFLKINTSTRRYINIIQIKYDIYIFISYIYMTLNSFDILLKDVDVKYKLLQEK